MCLELEISWMEVLKNDIESMYFKRLTDFIKDESKSYSIYPRKENIFRAFDLCKFHETKVVIVGQDPYHGENQANGLCFSVNNNAPSPPSLQNILKEVSTNTGTFSNAGNLERWARQGVLLLNSILTVRSGAPNSHKNQGWEKFTDAVITAINNQRHNVIFLLWGNYAQNKGHLIDDKKHCILKTTHPSPFSANKGFLGCRHFSKTNEFLEKNGMKQIHW